MDVLSALKAIVGTLGVVDLGDSYYTNSGKLIADNSKTATATNTHRNHKNGPQLPVPSTTKFAIVG